MPSAAPTALPLLLIVTGRPGAGKSTLTKALTEALRVPAVVRDQIKEGLVRDTAESADDANRRANRAFAAAIEAHIANGVSVLVEAAFQHKLWAPMVEPFRDRARLRVIVCTIDAALARQRCIDRATADRRREQFHDESAAIAAREGRSLPLTNYDPPRLDMPTLAIDTTSGYRPALERIADFANGLE